jgi:uncharacterized OB-fold protein
VGATLTGAPRTRTLPRPDDDTEFFWSSGRDGTLRFMRCAACGTWNHPPQPWCPKCLGHDVSPQPVSGEGTLFTYTVNYQQWDPGAEPYVVAIVEMGEQQDLKLTTNLVNCPVKEIRIGMPVRVVFEDHDPIWLPLFEPRPQ